MSQILHTVYGKEFPSRILALTIVKTLEWRNFRRVRIEYHGGEVSHSTLSPHEFNTHYIQWSWDTEMKKNRSLLLWNIHPSGGNAEKINKWDDFRFRSCENYLARWTELRGSGQMLTVDMTFKLRVEGVKKSVLWQVWDKCCKLTEPWGQKLWGSNEFGS